MAQQIKRFGQAECRMVADEAMRALEAVAAKYGLTLSKERGSFESVAFTFKAKFAAVSEDGTPADFARLAPLFGLKPDDWGREFRSGGKVYKIAGIQPRRTRFPIVGKSTLDGKTLLFPQEGIVAQMRAQDTKTA